MDTRFGQIEEQIKVMKDHLVAMDERSIEASILSAQVGTCFNSQHDLYLVLRHSIQAVMMEHCVSSRLFDCQMEKGQSQR